MTQDQFIRELQGFVAKGTSIQKLAARWYLNSNHLASAKSEQMTEAIRNIGLISEFTQDDLLYHFAHSLDNSHIHGEQTVPVLNNALKGFLDWKREAYM